MHSNWSVYDPRDPNKLVPGKRIVAATKVGDATNLSRLGKPYGSPAHLSSGICGAMSKRRMPCPQRAGSCPYHSPGAWLPQWGHLPLRQHSPPQREEPDGSLWGDEDREVDDPPPLPTGGRKSKGAWGGAEEGGEKPRKPGEGGTTARRHAAEEEAALGASSVLSLLHAHGHSNTPPEAEPASTPSTIDEMKKAVALLQAKIAEVPSSCALLWP
jgi:hypothetical protein